jgi:guanylate kinase
MSEHFTLTHIDEFRTALQQYEVSAENQQILKKLNLLLLVAPTATGRNTIIKELQKTGNYYFIVSDTTRPPKIRDGVMEQNGKQYFFRSEEEVLKDVQEGKYLEAAIIHNQQVSGISMRELERAVLMEKTAVTDIEVVGVRSIVRLKPDAICIFVLPPSFEEWQRRIRTREPLTDAELKNRLESALTELKMALDSDQYIFVVNDKLEEAAIKINSIAHFGIKDEDDQLIARKLAEQLFIQTRAYLE